MKTIKIYQITEEQFKNTEYIQDVETVEIETEDDWHYSDIVEINECLIAEKVVDAGDLFVYIIRNGENEIIDYVVELAEALVDKQIWAVTCLSTSFHNSAKGSMMDKLLGTRDEWEESVEYFATKEEAEKHYNTTKFPFTLNKETSYTYVQYKKLSMLHLSRVPEGLNDLVELSSYQEGEDIYLTNVPPNA